MTVYPPEGAYIVAVAVAIIAAHALMLGQRLGRMLIRWADRRRPRA